jgi:hypothetical protein
MKIIFFFIFILVVFSWSFGQGFNQHPKSWKFLKEDKLSSVYQLPELDIDSLIEEDKVNDKLPLPWRFGFKHQVSLGLENGQWSELENGDKIWRLKVYSPEALSLNIIFDQFFLPEGSELFLYDESHEHLLGRYTSKENQESNRFGTWLIESDNIIVEYYEPLSVSNDVRLNIESITHGYRNADSFKNQKNLNSSGDCNLDVDCSIGSDWDPLKELNKKSVGILISGGSSFCSGALVNNTANDQKPYFLTANHCYSNPANWSFKFEWISPDPICAMSGPGIDSATTKIISGATLRAKNANTDFCLVEINSAIPPSWGLTWVGWDKSDVVPTYVVGIHHPRGDIMKVCRDDSGPIKATNAGAQTWEITAADGGWEMGVTEGGSSGSPLFDQNGKVIGQLYGGGAACVGTVDNGLNDYYGRLALSWDGATASDRLKDWLDPTNSNVNTIESYPPFQVFATDASTSVKFPEAVCGQTTTTASVRLQNRGTDDLTSATISWSLNSGASSTINWVGNLSQNQTEDIQLGLLSSPNGNYVIDATVSFPNGSVDEFPGNDLSSESLSLFDNSFSTTKVYLDILTDNYSEETTWEFRDLNGTVLNQGGPYTADATHFLDTMDVVVGECYEFEIFDSENDGVCCVFGNGSYELTTDNNTLINQGGDFNSSELTEIYISGAVGFDKESKATKTLFFPNPFNDLLTIKTSLSNEFLEYKLLNSLGQEIKKGRLNEEITINVSSLSKGFYFIQLMNRDSVLETQKIIKH